MLRFLHAIRGLSNPVNFHLKNWTVDLEEEENPNGPLKLEKLDSPLALLLPLFDQGKV